MMVHSLCAVGNFHQDQLQVAPLLVALQNQVVLNQDAHLSYLDVARHFLQLVVVDAELRHLMRKDYFQDEEQPGAEVAAAP
jgi:hypothetical protein